MFVVILISGCATAPQGSNFKPIEKVQESSSSKKNDEVDINKLIITFSDSVQKVIKESNDLLKDINQSQYQILSNALAQKGIKSPTGNNLPKDGPDAKSLTLADLDQLTIITTVKDGSANAIYIDGQLVNLEKLQQLNGAMEKYATGLKTLAAAGSRKDIALATANLDSAVVNANSAYNDYTGDNGENTQIQSLAATTSSAIVELATTYTDHKKNLAIKKIINNSNTNVANYSREMTKTFQTFGQLPVNLKNQILLSEFLDYQMAVKSGSTSNEWRTDKVSKLGDLQSQAVLAKQRLSNLTESFLALQEAHQALLNAVNAEKIRPSLLKQVYGFKSKADNFKSFKKVLVDCKSGKYELKDSIVTCNSK